MKHISQFARLALVTAIVAGSATSAYATHIYNATGGTPGGGDPLSAAGPTLADRFVSAVAYRVDSVLLNLALGGPASTGFNINLFTDAGAAGPGSATLIASVRDTALTTAFQLLTYTPGTPITLAANTPYYIGITDLGGSAAVLNNTLDPAVLARPEVVAGGFYFNNGGVQANAGGPYQIRLNGTAVPEPAGWATLIAAFAALGLLRRRTSSVPTGALA